MGANNSKQIQKEQFQREWEKKSTNSDQGTIYWKHGDYRNQVEVYQITASDETDFDQEQNLYHIRKNHPYLVSAQNFIDLTTKETCSTNYEGDLHLERIPIRLSDLSHIPFPSSLHLYDAAIKGFSELHDRYGPFKVDQEHIGVNLRHQVKVWMNKNYSKSYPNNKARSQQEMIQTILQTIEADIDLEAHPPNQRSLRNIINSSNRNARFVDVGVILKEYANRYNRGIIPNHLQCIDEVGLNHVIQFCQHGNDFNFTKNKDQLNYNQTPIQISNHYHDSKAYYTAKFNDPVDSNTAYSTAKFNYDTIQPIERRNDTFISPSNAIYPFYSENDNVAIRTHRKPIFAKQVVETHQPVQYLKPQSVKSVEYVQTIQLQQQLHPQPQLLPPQPIKNLQPQPIQFLQPQTIQHLQPQPIQNLQLQPIQQLQPQHLQSQSIQHSQFQPVRHLQPETLQFQPVQQLQSQPIQQFQPIQTLPPIQNVQRFEPIQYINTTQRLQPQTQQMKGQQISNQQIIGTYIGERRPQAQTNMTKKESEIVHRIINQQDMYNQRNQSFGQSQPINQNNKKIFNVIMQGKSITQTPFQPQNAIQTQNQAQPTVPIVPMQPADQKITPGQTAQFIIQRQLIQAQNAQAQPAVQTQQAAQRQTIVQGQPAVQRQPAVQGHPAAQGQPAVQGQSAVQGHPAVQAKPIIQGQKVIQEQQANQGQQIVQGQNVFQGQPHIQGQNIVQRQPNVQGQDAIQSNKTRPPNQGQITMQNENQKQNAVGQYASRQQHRVLKRSNNEQLGLKSRQGRQARLDYQTINISNEGRADGFRVINSLGNEGLQLNQEVMSDFDISKVQSKHHYNNDSYDTRGIQNEYLQSSTSNFLWNQNSKYTIKDGGTNQQLLNQLKNGSNQKFTTFQYKTYDLNTKDYNQDFKSQYVDYSGKEYSDKGEYSGREDYSGRNQYKSDYGLTDEYRGEYKTNYNNDYKYDYKIGQTDYKPQYNDTKYTNYDSYKTQQYGKTTYNSLQNNLEMKQSVTKPEYNYKSDYQYNDYPTYSQNELKNYTDYNSYSNYDTYSYETKNHATNDDDDEYHIDYDPEILADLQAIK